MLADLDFITKKLQNHLLAIADARTLFDASLKQLPFANATLMQNSAIMENPGFEASFLKIQNKLKDKLSSIEWKYVKVLFKPEKSASFASMDCGLSFAEKLLRRRSLS